MYSSRQLLSPFGYFLHGVRTRAWSSVVYKAPLIMLPWSLDVPSRSKRPWNVKFLHEIFKHQQEYSGGQAIEVFLACYRVHAPMTELHMFFWSVSDNTAYSRLSPCFARQVPISPSCLAYFDSLVTREFERRPRMQSFSKSFFGFWYPRPGLKIVELPRCRETFFS